MPKCNNCGKVQGRLNNGLLCKECHRAANENQPIHPNNSSDSSKTVSAIYEQSSPLNYSRPFENRVIDTVNKMMAQEREMSSELIAILKSEIAYLKGDVLHKNNLLQILMQDKISSPAHPIMVPPKNHDHFDDIPLNDNAHDLNSINDTEKDDSQLVDEQWHFESRSKKLFQNLLVDLV